MRVQMLTWEYPPLVVGGLGRHVEALARELVAAGHEVQVVTRGEKDEILDDVVDGVHVRRAAADPVAIDFTTESLLAWAQAAEHSLLRAALPLGRPDVVHAHDWLVAQSALTLTATTGAPLVATIHATEAGRHQGWLPAPLNAAIHSIERWLAHSAQAVVTCSGEMRAEVARLFQLAEDDIVVIPNGVDVAHWRTQRRQRSAAPRLAFVGRLVHEKGVQTLLDALRPLRELHPGLQVTVAGTGTSEVALHARARRLRIARNVEWLGYVPDEDIVAVFASADAVIVPSLYEPFGLVALEAAAAQVPVVVAETGGLRDLIADGVATASFPPGDISALISSVDGVLRDPAAARRAVVRASRVIRHAYAWSAVAAHTAEVYRRAAGGRSVR